MSLLTICQEVADEVGISQPTSIVGNSSTTARRLLSIANASGKRLARKHPWQELVTEQTITTVATESQGTVASLIDNGDFDRFIPHTHYNRSNSRSVEGSLTPAQFQQDKAFSTVGIYDRFYIRGDNLLITPAPAAGETIAFEYVSSHWAKTHDSATTKEKFTVDTDLPRIDEDVLKLDMVWRMLRAMGIDYAAQKVEFEKQLAAYIGRNTPSQIISQDPDDYNQQVVGIANQGII